MSDPDGFKPDQAQIKDFLKFIGAKVEGQRAMEDQAKDQTEYLERELVPALRFD